MTKKYRTPINEARQEPSAYSSIIRRCITRLCIWGLLPVRVGLWLEGEK